MQWRQPVLSDKIIYTHGKTAMVCKRIMRLTPIMPSSTWNPRQQHECRAQSHIAWQKRWTWIEQYRRFNMEALHILGLLLFIQCIHATSKIGMKYKMISETDKICSVNETLLVRSRLECATSCNMNETCFQLWFTAGLPTKHECVICTEFETLPGPSQSELGLFVLVGTSQILSPG